MRDVILPWALGDTDLGVDVLEVGPGYGACTDVLTSALPRVTSVEIDDELAAMLAERFAGDVYNPVDPALLPDRLTAAGFERIDVRTNPYGWAVIARRS